MRGLRAKAAKKFKATTNSNYQLPVAPNLLQQNFFANKPNEKWVSDITYCWTQEDWLYLAVVMDLYSRKIVGWSIIHSDRGSQYCSYEYQTILKLHGLECSIGKRGDCYDNTAMESDLQRVIVLKNMCSNILKFTTIENVFIRCLVINHPHLLRSKKWLSKLSDFSRQDHCSRLPFVGHIKRASGIMSLSLSQSKRTAGQVQIYFDMA